MASNTEQGTPATATETITTRDDNRGSGDNIDPRDNLDDVMQYIRNGRIHAVSFAKHLPYTAKGIRDGGIDPLLLAMKLTDFIAEEEHEKDANIFFMPSFNSALNKGPAYIGYFLSNYAVPADWFQNENRSGTPADGVRKEAILELSKAICENGCNMDALEKAFRRACVQCANMIDCKAFDGNRGSFLRVCPLLTNRQQFQTVADQGKRLLSKLECTTRQLMDAAIGVYAGTHESELACWECGIPTETNVCSCCGGCGLAAYCSRECQSSAWKAGHKHKCILLKSKYEACEQAYAAMEAFYDEKQQDGSLPIVHCGIPLNHYIDCRVTATAHGIHPNFIMDCHLAHLEPACHPESLGPPSIDMFYINLGKVAEDEWWLWPPSETEGLATYKAQINNEDDFVYFEFLASLLFFNFAGDNDTYYQWIRNIQGYVRIHEPMPAQRFLEIYKRAACKFSDPVDRSLRYRSHKCEILERIQEKYHK